MELREEYRIDMLTYQRLMGQADTLFLEPGTLYIHVTEEYEVAERNLPIGIKGWYVSLRKAISLELRCDYAIRVI